MSKKRVYELAKELGLSNTDMVTWLKAHDYDVKNHSSSLEEDQAAAVSEKIAGEKKPKVEAPRPASTGVVLRRKKATDGAAVEVAPVMAEPAPPPAPEPVAQPEPAPVAAAIEPEPPRTQGTPRSAHPAVDRAQPTPVAEPAAVVAEEPAAVAEKTHPVAAEAAPGPQAAAAKVEHSAPAAGADLHHHPIPQGVQHAVVGKAPPAHIAAKALDGKSAKPTATQAVVINRPLIAVTRPPPRPPTRGAGAGVPPGSFPSRNVGEVRELKVVPGMLGREREFIDVTRDKSGAKKKSGPRLDKVENISKADLIELARQRAHVPIRGRKKRPTRKGAKTEITEMKASKKVVRLDEQISLGDLSQTMGVKSTDLIRKLITKGQMVNINSLLTADQAEELATSYGWEVQRVGFDVEEFIPEEEADVEAEMRTRPPVVTIMGHVDHGKTSLLDAIRQTEVAAGEAGGITQHIGAYSVKVGDGVVTFLDTPGHEAFTAMRARGAQATDVVVLVVDATDGAMPQTIEALNHAKAAGVPIVVALNKMDKPTANPERVMKQLSEHELLPEDWGGQTIYVKVSARTKEGVDKLLEMLLLQAEVLELKSNPGKPAQGVVIEAKLEKGRGPVATVLVQEGTLRRGDPIVTGEVFGKVRAMSNDKGEMVEEVLPGFPVEVFGLSGVPTAGDDFNVVESVDAAKEIAEHRERKTREKDMPKTSKITLEEFFAKSATAGEQKDLKLVVKGDVQGSVEAVTEALRKLSTPKVKVSIIHHGVGAITETDVMLASASNAIVFGFNVRPESGAAEAAGQEQTDIRTYSIIYEMVDEVKKAMEGLLEPTIREKTLGKAEVRNTFNVPKLGTIAGCAVTDGVIKRNSLVRLLRDGKVVHTGKVASLRRFKDDAREVASGFECGVGLEGYNDLVVGDVLETFEMEEIRQSL